MTVSYLFTSWREAVVTRERRRLGLNSSVPEVGSSCRTTRSIEPGVGWDRLPGPTHKIDTIRLPVTRIAVDVPEEIAKRLESAWRDVSRGALEAVALEGYRDGTLSRDQIGQLLGFSLWETEAFLKQRQAYLQYTEEDLALDRRALDGAMPQ